MVGVCGGVVFLVARAVSVGGGACSRTAQGAHGLTPGRREGEDQAQADGRRAPHGNGGQEQGFLAPFASLRIARAVNKENGMKSRLLCFSNIFAV